jgi:hypothetical protein
VNMDFDSTDRTSGEYAMFALGFIGFIIAAGGVVLSLTPLAVIGALLLLIAVYSFRSSRPRSLDGR